jgi:hypothetical protein
MISGCSGVMQDDGMGRAGVSNPKFADSIQYKVAVNRTQKPIVIYSQQRRMFNDNGEPAVSKKGPLPRAFFLINVAVA